MTNTTYTPRMEGLDALRGFALFGIFIVHMPELFELYWAHPATDPLQRAVHDAVWLVFAGKAFALLALCFGVSFFIIMDRAARLRAAGQAALTRHLGRQVGRTLSGLVEREGVARAEDFTEIAFTGQAPVGGVAPMRVTGHDGTRVIAIVV